MDMQNYLVTMSYNVDGSGSSMGINVNAYSEVHACEVAKSQYPDMYPLCAERT
ncbi:hypothetical protein [Polynucleobacter sp. JS-Polo-80-F4]|uniref:hypothetical protein n=1 Tax=Polynucleobacter sp. JS-Polo-80-F4 TaxID=2576918 RepID=UPI001C0D8B96|nr:hypothetical protein [Polynucleobacter sp. JS-Polo-80-F4]MBU3617276.1 hypothetical protein [Polynucleobacter sp. JS-Polo-80-F4]